MNLSFQNVRKDFGALPVIQDLSFETGDGAFLALVGPSGSGKSTVLHIAAGLEPPSSGLVMADGRPIQGASPERTLVFQEHALYPWLTLQENVSIALELQGVGRKEALAEAETWLARVQLGGFEDYYPHKVSGGMRQRTALARAFIARPKLLLLDEPFGALDALTKMALQDVLLELIEDHDLSVMLVTHDVDEALYLAKRIMVFSPRPAQVLADLALESKSYSRDPASYAAERRQILSLLGVSDASQSSKSTQTNTTDKELQHA